MAGDAIWLDITRTLSRVGRGPPTGIDRVETAYIQGLIQRETTFCGFARTASGYALLDRTGLIACMDRIEGRHPWGPPDLAGRLSRRLTPERRRAEADLRRLAVATCMRGALPRLLKTHLAPCTAYLNVGHSNLTPTVLGGFAAAGAKLCVFVHDTIPLDLPEDHRPETVATFKARMAAVQAHGSLVICPSASAASDVARYVDVPSIVAHPGVELAEADAAALPPDLDQNRPYFVALGTIDARKNQTLLMDVWAQMGPAAPTLYLVGTRGWVPDALNAQLTNPPAEVHELSGLSDGAVAALLEGSAGLLHPSRAEGFGFTLLEAGLRGIPVLAADLPVYRETLGDIGVYAPLDDLYQWGSTINEWADRHRHPSEQYATRKPHHPAWDTHLNVVLSHL